MPPAAPRRAPVQDDRVEPQRVEPVEESRLLVAGEQLGR
jgi:hypothetical protein